MASAVFADNLLVDGDGLEAVGNNELLFGSVCTNSQTTKDVLIAVTRSNNANAQPDKVFANSTSTADNIVTVTRTGLNGTGITESIPGSNEIIMPEDWVANSGTSGYVTSEVTFTAGATTGSAGGNLTYHGSGEAVDGSTLNVAKTMGWSATVVTCASNSAPTITSASFSPSPASCTVDTNGHNVTLSVAFTDADSTSWTAEIDWNNDGTYDQTVSSITASPFSVGHFFAPGAHKIAVRLTDNQGATSAAANATAVVNYTVQGGNFLAPLTGTQGGGTPTFSAKSTIPAKADIRDCDGDPVLNATAVIQVWQTSTSPPPDSVPSEDPANTNNPDSGSLMRWTGEHYQYNLAASSLKDSTATYSIRARITLPSFGGAATTYQYAGPTDFGLKAK